MRLASWSLALLCVAGAPASAQVGRYRVSARGAPALGPADARVTVVEFSDFYCGYCRKAAETLAELHQLFPDDLRLVYRHNLLDPEEGTLAAEASLAAAAQGRFWAFHDRAFFGGERLTRDAVLAYARELGLDLVRFRRDLDEHRFAEALRAEEKIGSALGVSSTPMFFVNGRPISGAQPLTVFIDVVREELAARGGSYDEIMARARRGPIDQDDGEPDGATLDPGAIYPVEAGLPAQRRGPDDALVTLVEFADYRCGFCVRVRPTLAALAARYGDKLRVVHRLFPLGDSAISKRWAEAALAAGEQGKLFEFGERLYDAAGELERPDLERIAADLGLDLGRFRQALDERRLLPAVAADADEAASYGVSGTPTFFINGAPLVGAQPSEAFEALIDQKLAEAERLVKRGVAPAAIYRTVTGAGAEP